MELVKTTIQSSTIESTIEFFQFRTIKTPLNLKVNVLINVEYQRLQKFKVVF